MLRVYVIWPATPSAPVGVRVLVSARTGALRTVFEVIEVLLPAPS